MKNKFEILSKSLATATTTHSHACVHLAFRKIKLIFYTIHILSN